ncbi:MAG TPA: hypothetical protein VH306_08790 [Gaiellaceae bacterium]|jgi:hypothetical protein
MERKLLAVLAATGAIALGMLFAVGAAADGRHHGHHGHHHGHHAKTLLFSTIAPTVPNDDTIHGVAPGGLPWVIKRGEARLRANGKLEVEVKGLVIPTPPQNGTNPVPMLAASLFCGDDTTAAATTAAVPFDTRGNAKIRARITLPEKCLAPAILLNPNGSTAAYIAATGFER